METILEGGDYPGWRHYRAEAPWQLPAPGIYELAVDVRQDDAVLEHEIVVFSFGQGALPPGDSTVVIPDGLRLKFELIALGKFLMGAPESDPEGEDREKPQHEVVIMNGFYMGKFEVMQWQWEAVMGTTPWAGRMESSVDYVREEPNNPAVYVSGNDVQAFVHTLNEAAGDSLYRLPTEAEWEYACRAGTTTRWSFGDIAGNVGDYAWFNDNTWIEDQKYAHEVGTKPPNPWGLYDMHGNVEEWCLDRYGAYPGGAQVDPSGPDSGDGRVFRGGAFTTPSIACGPRTATIPCRPSLITLSVCDW